MNEPIAFAELRQLLLDLGFSENRVRENHFLFEHAASGAVFLYPDYQPTETVQPVHVSVTRKQLDERGLLAGRDFDSRWRKASA